MNRIGNNKTETSTEDIGRSRSLIRSVSIGRIQAKDVSYCTDQFANLQGLIYQHQDLYPNIEGWFEDTVKEELCEGGRSAYVGYSDDDPVVSAIVKPRGDSKFCHLHIAEEYRGRNIGELFFCLMALEVKRVASAVHFTLPESLWERDQDFFRGFGFETPAVSSTQYRDSQRELICRANFESVWSAVKEKLPKLIRRFGVGEHEMSEGVVLAVRPKYAQAIMEERKLVEVRRQFSDKWVGKNACLYASAPVKGLVGEARIEDVIKASPSAIWQEFGSYVGGNRSEYFEYVAGNDEVYAIVFGRVSPYVAPISLTQVSHLLGKELTPPQNYLTAGLGSDWSAGIALVTLLQARRRQKGSAELLAE